MDPPTQSPPRKCTRARASRRGGKAPVALVVQLCRPHTIVTVSIERIAAIRCFCRFCPRRIQPTMVLCVPLFSAISSLRTWPDMDSSKFSTTWFSVFLRWNEFTLTLFYPTGMPKVCSQCGESRGRTKFTDGQWKKAEGMCRPCTTEPLAEVMAAIALDGKDGRRV